MNLKSKSINFVVCDPLFRQLEPSSKHIHKLYGNGAKYRHFGIHRDINGNVIVSTHVGVGL